MYGKVKGWMTETTPINPCSKKGEVRAKIANLILDEIKAGTLHGLIARAPDFYGPKGTLGFVNFLLFENYAKSKSAQWLLDDYHKHTFIYTPDASKATAILGNTPEAYDQVWHLPSDSNVITGKEMINMSANAFDVKPNYMTLSKWMVKMYGLFDKSVKESIEMLYQYENDYLFDSSKFQKHFNFAPTSYQDGIRTIPQSYKI